MHHIILVALAALALIATTAALDAINTRDQHMHAVHACVHQTAPQNLPDIDKWNTYAPQCARDLTK